MIKKNEINKIALSLGVRTSTIDKDWVLGHFIDAIFSIPQCSDNLIFKGGTCLKKCRFPNYRFSEDLDFTSTKSDFVLDMALLTQITNLVSQRTELPLHIASLEELRFENRLTGYAAHVKYWGADHRIDQQPPEPARWTSSVKIEIILYEQMFLEAELRPIVHPYSDTLVTSEIPCYSITEVLSEKLRALIQRSYTAPRDYYDIWYLSKHVEKIDWDTVVKAFHQKMAYKGLKLSSISELLNPDNDKVLKAAWKNSLEHQITAKEFVDYKTVKNHLSDLFSRIFVFE